MPKQKRLFRLTLLVCLIALVVSLAFNSLLFLQARHYYLLLNQTNLDPLGLRAFSTDSLPDDIAATSINNRGILWRFASRNVARSGNSQGLF